MTPGKDALTCDPVYPFLKGHLIETTGLHYYADKDDDLAGRIHRRLSTLGVRDCASYLDILKDPLQGRRELDELIGEITIGETYFFRHQEHFEALRDIVLPDLIARNHAQRSLRIWSAGCADGPEAYSLAILLNREMSHKLVGWEVNIIATDINRRSLARARVGKYEEWALRAISEDLKRDCFSKEGTSWQIAPRFKQWISFQYHNLVEDPAPSLVNNLTAFDLIVCRNVTIYFAPDLTHKMIQRFHDCLVEGAWLLVGPAEPNMTSFSAFSAVNAPGVTLYRKGPQYPKAATMTYPVMETSPLPPPRLPVVPTGSTPIVTPAIPEVEDRLADVRLYADRGEWANAVRCCERLLKKDSLNSLVHFYFGLVLGQMGRYSEAEPALRKAIYLNRQSPLPHYYLGLFLQSRGDPGQAARSFENAIELLESRPDGDVLADADGITAGEMKKLAKMHLEVLQTR
ncbi:MAG TPA: CheR family methyltransferase [Bryobacteraceae bacterium]|jgi:chemotaxis protein methyltransferase CheR|nr:CheR family methyltransferase [Bryobacteraceae bacterium]